jgi:DNA-binding transcriptional MerR regulator
MAYTVSEVARIATVSVRTLHHYDDLGLLLPSARTEAGYRLYTDADLERLQQILFFRELGFPLEEIGRMLSDPAYDRRAALAMQRQLLGEKITRLTAMLAAVDATARALEGGSTMSKEALFEVFGNDDPTRYEAEAEQRWGNTEAFRESKKRTARYGKKEWAELKAEGDALFARLAALAAAGHRVDDPEVMDVAEAHRAHIEKWFYPCPPELHRGLGQLYVNDPRFGESLDRLGAGLATFAAEAFAANAQRRAKPGR